MITDGLMYPATLLFGAVAIKALAQCLVKSLNRNLIIGTHAVELPQDLAAVQKERYTFGSGCEN